MQLRLHNFKGNEAVFLRRCGYGFLGVTGGESVFETRLGVDDYPRFHIYAKMDGADLLVNLHLDQKKPSYPSVHKHNAEYEGEVVGLELRRIKNFYENPN